MVSIENLPDQRGCLQGPSGLDRGAEEQAFGILRMQPAAEIFGKYRFFE